MSQAPPVEPPIIFPIMSAARIRSHIWGLLLNGALLYLGITGVKINIAEHRSIVVSVFVAIFALLMFLLSSFSWLRDQGSQIMIQGNRIEVRSGNGELRTSGLLTNVIELRASQNVPRPRPWSYCVIFSNQRRIIFDRNIPNLDSLILLLEERTGKQFVIHRS